MQSFIDMLRGLGITILILGGFIAYSSSIAFINRSILHYSREQWREFRKQSFWLLNTLYSPFFFLYFAGVAYALRLTPQTIGFNLHNLNLSLIVSLSVAAVLGTASAISSVYATKQGISIMHVSFGRSLKDVIGAIGYTAVLVGPLEEILFRGIIQTVLMRALPQTAHVGPFSFILGTFVAAIIFVAYHFRNVIIGGETAIQFFRLSPGRTIASVFLSLLFQGTGSLLGPILFHNIIDTCTVSAISITSYRMRKAPSLT